MRQLTLKVLSLILGVGDKELVGIRDRNQFLSTVSKAEMNTGHLG